MSFSETIFLFFLALIIFGPKKLPEIARQVGKYLNEFKRASNEFKAQIEQEIAHLEVENKQTILPPTEAPEGALSRSGSTEAVSDAPATLAAPPEVAPANGNSNSTSSVPAEVATEAVPADDSVTAPASQESHA
jgi:sec-independent protein translocase protein TatB